MKLTYFNNRNMHYLLHVSYILVDMMQSFLIAKIWIYQKDNTVMYGIQMVNVNGYTYFLRMKLWVNKWINN